MNKITDFSNAGPLTSIKHWLIHKIAGKSLVMLNVKIDIVPRKDYPEGSAAIARDISGGVVRGVSFPNYGDTLIHISQRVQ